MGRPPCCDKVGIKKGPWTPEEDIILVSYIQEHGPGNWRAVPTNTGLLRCSKSCRLRWTNYLRPGIKRGNFTPHEEGMIIHLQALLGNKWAAIATYLPQRTDNDIKNYWNTHLKKKLKKFHQSGFDHHHQPHGPSDSASAANNYHHFISNKSNYGGVNNNIDISSSTINKHESSSSSVYASSAENISRLLEGWMRSSSSSSPPQANNMINSNNINSIVTYDPNDKFFYSDFGKINNNNNNVINPTDDDHHGSMSSIQCYRPNDIGMVPSNGHHQLDSVLLSTIDGRSNCEKSSCDSSQKGSEGSNMGLIDQMNMNVDEHQQTAKMDDEIVNPPMSFLEKWLLDESAAQVMELPSMF